MRLMMAAKTIIRRYSEGSNDSLELNLSYESSSFDESIDDAIPLGTKPYLFEPEVSSEEESTASSPEKSTHERMVKTVNGRGYLDPSTWSISQALDVIYFFS